MLLMNPPLRCPDHPDNNLFTKVTTRRTKVDGRGKHPAGANPSTIQVVFVSDCCDDIVRKEPLHHHRSIKR